VGTHVRKLLQNLLQCERLLLAQSGELPRCGNSVANGAKRTLSAPLTLAEFACLSADALARCDGHMHRIVSIRLRAR
jgi:hypothetical protein